MVKGSILQEEKSSVHKHLKIVKIHDSKMRELKQEIDRSTIIWIRTLWDNNDLGIAHFVTLLFQ